MSEIFEQLPKEGAKAFEAFCLYLNMGPRRSVEAVRVKCGKSSRLIQRWSSRWQWGERVQAYATHMAALERETAEALVRAKGVDWFKRQQELREREWAMHEKCIAAAERGLKAFMEREKVYANLGDIARIVEVGSRVGRMAAGMATDKTETVGEESAPIRLELNLALNKIYGPEGEATRGGEVLDVESVLPHGEGERTACPAKGLEENP